MNLHNFYSYTTRKLLIATGLLISAMSAQASVIYNFTSAPIFVDILQDTGNNIITTGAGPFPVATPQTASLTFASPLAPNSTTQLSAESGGYDFIGPPNQGGLEAYSAPGFFPQSITSDINEYITGTFGDVISVLLYSSLVGEVTTDASGNISAWDLSFVRYSDNDGGFIIDTVAKTIDSAPGQVDALLDISSAPASLITIGNVVALNGVPSTDDFTFNGADTTFVDFGNVQNRDYTQQPGSFETSNPVPTPNTLLLMGAALLGWGFIVRLQRRSRLLRC